MNVRKSKKGHRSMSFAPYGRIPLRDGKASIDLTLTEPAVRLGKKNNPMGCAIALELKYDAIAGTIAESVPGFLGVQVRKTATLIARTHRGQIVCERYVHSPELTERINGFDAGAEKALKAGDRVVLMAPRGGRRIGKSNGTSRSGSIVPKNPRKHKACVRRGVYLDPVHAKQAMTEPSLSVK
jgi:hypothetical protein